jgi:hypothetical protein
LIQRLVEWSCLRLGIAPREQIEVAPTDWNPDAPGENPTAHETLSGITALALHFAPGGPATAPRLSRFGHLALHVFFGRHRLSMSREWR